MLRPWRSIKRKTQIKRRAAYHTRALLIILLQLLLCDASIIARALFSATTKAVKGEVCSAKWNKNAAEIKQWIKMKWKRCILRSGWSMMSWTLSQPQRRNDPSILKHWFISARNEIQPYFWDKEKTSEDEFDVGLQRKQKNSGFWGFRKGAKTWISKPSK